MSAMNNLLLLQYNNHFNRVIKKEETYEAYLNASFNYKITEKYNFNPNDDVQTEIVVNWDEKWSPDYLVVLDVADIVSRWFIIEAVRIRAKQYRLSIRRDLIADYMQQVTTSPCFIQKGFVVAGHPLIFNQENISTNQIKKSEQLLYDGTGTSWLTIYYNLSKKASLKGSINIDEEPAIDIGTTLSEWYPTIRTQGFKMTESIKFTMTVSAIDELNSSVINSFRYLFNDYGQSEDWERIYNANITQFRSTGYKGPFALEDKLNEVLKTQSSVLHTALINEFTEGDQQTFNELAYYNDKIIKTSDNKYFRIKFVPNGAGTYTSEITSGTSFNIINNLFFPNDEPIEGFGGRISGPTSSGAIHRRIDYVKYILYAEEITNSIRTLSYDFSGVKDINDQPYGILAIPYQYYTGESVQISGWRSDYNIALRIARDLAKEGTGSDKPIYDIQILPYCPIPEAWQDEDFDYIRPWIRLSNLESNQYTILKDSNNNNVCLALHPTKSKFTFNYYMVSERLPNLNIDSKLFKVRSQTDFVRLCSPNYNGVFEFSIYKNGGLSYINVDCTYKPYQPYIHINPDFSGLYGQDFNDPRGLICGGDFSLTTVSSAWESYKLQNKNYQNIFDRQVTNLEVNQDIARDKARFSAGMAILGSTAAGALKGGVGGALVGAATSTVTSMVGLSQMERSQAEQKDYMTDIHEFQLQNIQALPDALSKVDAYNNNNKIFPVLEFYGCTQVEENIFLKKIQYEGMTINAIGTIRDYKSSSETFIKGQMIRLEGMSQDTHLFNAIYDEIAKGVYL